MAGTASLAGAAGKLRDTAIDRDAVRSLWTGPASFEHARQLVMQLGWNATSYQILNPGIQHWFDPAGDAVIGYVLRHRVRVVAGAPIAPIDRLPGVAAAFEAEAATAGQRVCYMCAEGRVEALYRERPNYSMVLLGAQPVWDPHDWPAVIKRKSSLRAQLNRARNKGVTIELWPSSVAENDPRLEGCLDEWLNSRALPALHFLIEPETLARLADRRVFVATRNEQVVGFLIASPVPVRQGWLVEQNLRGDKAPNGTSELLLDAAMRVLADEGATYVTLGLAPLAQQGADETGPNPLWLRILLFWLRAHGRRFYNFRGLENFKAKFEPARWDPVYAVANERKFSPLTLYAVAAAFSHGSPLTLIARGMWKALATEARWLFSRRRA